MTSDDKKKPVELSPRSMQLLELAARGMTNDQIAIELDLSRFTIRGQFNRIFKQLGVHNRTSAVHKWRCEIPANALLDQLRRSRASNQENIVALQELIRLQTAAIEIVLERTSREWGKET